ncbi:MAG: hypothetical protein PUB69_06585 [Desulfovibrionaceae bacterium]|nr:hypothetical protein [Desulfovibrionaceae bacterium]
MNQEEAKIEEFLLRKGKERKGKERKGKRSFFFAFGTLPEWGGV